MVIKNQLSWTLSDEKKKKKNKPLKKILLHKLVQQLTTSIGKIKIEPTFTFLSTDKFDTIQFFYRLTRILIISYNIVIIYFLKIFIFE